MKKLFLFLVVLTSMSFSQVNPTCIISGTLSAGTTSLNSSTYRNIGTFNGVTLGFSVNDSCKFAVAVKYKVGGTSYFATMTPAVGDTITGTTDAGEYQALILRGHNGAGTFVNRIPGATEVYVTLTRVASGSPTAVTVKNYLVFKN